MFVGYGRLPRCDCNGSGIGQGDLPSSEGTRDKRARNFHRPRHIKIEDFGSRAEGERHGDVRFLGDMSSEPSSVAAMSQEAS